MWLLLIGAPRPVAGLLAPAAAWANEPAGEQPRERTGKIVRVPSPITDRVEHRVRRAVEELLAATKFDADSDHWPVLILEIAPGRSDFGKALDLARFLTSSSTSGLTTVAFLPETIEGHALLVALACDEIAMAPDAEIGNAGRDESSIGPAIRSGYVEIAERRGNVPRDLVLGLLDPQLEVLQVETDVSREFVLRSRLDALRQRKAVGTVKVLIPAGQPGHFTAQEARELGLVRYVAADRLAVATALKLPREAVEDDPSLDGAWQPIRVKLHGPIHARLVEQLQATIDRQVRQAGANFLCIDLNSPGGNPEQSQRLANYLLSLDSSQVRTVAFIERQALADAAWIALACDHIVMTPRAVLGGSGAFEIPDDEVAYYADVAAKLAGRKMRSQSLAAAMIDPDLVVYRCQRRDDGWIDYFSQAELQSRPDAAQWQRGEAIAPPGQPLQLDADHALQWRVAYAVVDDFHELAQLYGLESDPAMIEPGWADYLVESLSSPLAAGTLLALALIGLYFELQHPGLGLGGFVSGVCFLLFFWANYLGGTAGWLEGLLFIAGITCILIEIFLVPGLGVFGVGGGALIIASLVLASQTFVLPRNEYQLAQLRNSLAVVVGAGAVFIGAAIVARRYLPSTPLLNQVFLPPPSPEEKQRIALREVGTPRDHLVGQRGRAATRLSPAGKVRIGDELVDVVTDGELIEKGAHVVVIEARGNHVVVTQIEDETVA